MATAAINVAFGFGTSLAWFCFFWGLNGTLQVRSRGFAVRADCNSGRVGLHECQLPRLQQQAVCQALGVVAATGHTGSAPWPRLNHGCSWLRVTPIIGWVTSVPQHGTACCSAGCWRSLLCSYPDHLVCQQGARYILGHVEHCTQPRRICSTIDSWWICQEHGLAVGYVCTRYHRPGGGMLRAGGLVSRHARAGSLQTRDCHNIAVASTVQTSLCSKPPITLTPCLGRMHFIYNSAKIVECGPLHQHLCYVCCCTCSKDKPEDAGFPPVEPVSEKAAAAAKDKPKPNVLKQLVNNVLKNPFIWGMALTYFFIYVVRQVR